MSDYLNLAMPAKFRLQYLKNAADKLNAGHNARKASGNPEPYTWRDVRYSGFRNVAGLGQGFNTCPYTKKKTPIWYCHTGQVFPREIFADQFIGNHGRPLIEHAGYFADVDCSETVRGIVVRLPHGRFLAGYYMSVNGERVYFSEIYTCEREAVYSADHHAETLAETEREYSENWNKAQELRDDLSDKLERLRECLTLRNNPCFVKARREVSGLIETIREIREDLSGKYAEFV